MPIFSDSAASQQVVDKVESLVDIATDSNFFS